jgi:hypothetical protein
VVKPRRLRQAERRASNQKAWNACRILVCNLHGKRIIFRFLLQSLLWTLYFVLKN